MEFSSGEELLRFWEQEDREQLDILFLDISMDGTDGMETAEQIRDWKEEREEVLWGSLPLLIFVTGYPEYMPKAFSVNAFQYLVKPVDEKEFEDVFARAARECRCLNRKKNTESGEILVQHCRNNSEYSTRYFRHHRVVVSQRCTRHRLLPPPCADKNNVHCIHCYFCNAVLVL